MTDKSDTAGIETQGRRLLDWFSNEAVGAWHRSGFDPVWGRGAERLSSDGRAELASTIRTRTQARLIFVFCVAHHLRWPVDAAARVAGLCDFVDEYCRADDGRGYVRSLSADLSERDSGIDLYDQACFLLADAWRYRAFGDESSIDDAWRTAGMLDERFAHASGGWLEGDYEYEHRRQNPHMHMFEAFLALFSATGDEAWLEKAGRVHELFVERFFDADSGVLLEYFDESLHPAPGETGRTAEPGHMMEWVWLLRWYERESGTPAAPHANALFANALDHGRSDSGLLYDAVSADGRVLAGTRRLWPMTELVKASLMQARAGQLEHEQTAASAIAAFCTQFVDRSGGAIYCDQLDENDDVIAASAAASSMYHLAAAVIELNYYLTADDRRAGAG